MAEPIAPLLVVPIQIRYGWRASFYIFGALGVSWATIWYVWFRDTPAEKASASRSNNLAALPPEGHSFPWRVALRSSSVQALLATAFCYVYVYNFFLTWFHTFLIKGRGFTEGNLVLSALPYAVAACANLGGGAASDVLVKKMGLKRGRRALGAASLAFAGLLTLAAMVARAHFLTVLLLSLVYGAICFQQSGVFGACIDIGRKRAGAMVGLMNTSSQIGGLLGSVAYGYIVDRFGSYDAPFVPMTTLLFLGALLWLKVDASEELNADRSISPTPLAV